MKKIILILTITLLANNTNAQVPYYKVRYEEGKECRYFYSGKMQKGMEDLVGVQCFDN